jgi:subtilisin family serine protease
MAVNKPGFFVGVAPLAKYWFLRTEDQQSEFPIEEDYLVSALEFADSVGVDVVNTSLYYTSHDGPTYHYKYENMDGRTAFASQGANMAADKGMLIFSCAGNDHSWVGTPADSPDVLAIGSVNSSRIIYSLGSFGLTVDGRMKPDLVGMGDFASVITPSGVSMKRSGTSYASPIVCGLAACLWAAYPKLNNRDIREVMLKASDRYSNPVLPYGYGIPDMKKAMELAQVLSDRK